MAETLTNLNGRFNLFVQDTHHFRDDLSTKVSMHERDLYGESFDKPGLKTIVDRQRETEKARSRLSWILITGMAGLILERILHSLTF